MEKTRAGYRGLRKVFLRYWSIYGGLPAVLRSPYFHLSLLLLIVTTSIWRDTSWWDQVIDVLPSLLGFTLGGFAIFLGFGDEKFKSVIAGTDPSEAEDYSPYMSVSATFLHFVVVQILGLLFAIAAKALHFESTLMGVVPFAYWIGLFGDLIGYWIFLYGICLALAAGVGIFRVAGWYDEHQTRSRKTAANADRA